LRARWTRSRPRRGRDIKVDARHPGTGAGPYYQNDPEEPLPLSHVGFDRLIDNSQNLPQTDLANVHVQVHDRSYTVLDNVWVWAIWCRPSGGVPSLATNPSMGNMFDFWGQFHVNGTINPNLPMDSPWNSVGPPVVLSGLDVWHPQVATFPDWQVPALAPGDNGHYCMVAFVHSQANKINESSSSVDAIATSNPQVAQKNLHVSTMLPMERIRGGFGLREYIEFHARGLEESLADLVFDFSDLPEGLQAAVQLTHLQTEGGLEKAIAGATRRYAGEAKGQPAGTR
jgi:hypothetical protein